jgi:hypothetical protein
MDTASHNTPIQNHITDIFNVVSIDHAADNGGIVTGAPKGAKKISSKASRPAMGPTAQVGNAAEA